MRGSRKFGQWGSNFVKVFKLMRGRQRIHITLKSDHLNCVSLAGGDGPTLNAGLVAL